MKILELFSGTGSIGKVAEARGHEVYSVDISDKFYKPTHKGDILKWDYKQFTEGHFDYIHASPPCCAFSSILNICKTKEERIKYEKEHGLPFLIRTREIIDYLKPKYYSIENPESGRMKNYITDLPFVKVCYCMYGYLYKKPTRIWTNIEFTPKYCKPSKGCKHSRKHPRSIAMTRRKETGGPLDKYIINTEVHISKDKGVRYRIPEKLCIDLIEGCENNL